MINDKILEADRDNQILHPGSRKLFAHWEILRAERAYPIREEFTFTPVKELMPDMILIEKDHLRDSYRFRLAGSRVCEVFGRNVTGADVLSGWDSFEVDVLKSHLEIATRNFQPVLVRMRLLTDTGQTIAAELIALPIQARDSSRVQLIGGLFSFRDTRNLGHTGIRSRELVSARTIWTEHGNSSKRMISAGELPPLPRRPIAPRLRLVEGGRRSH